MKWQTARRVTRLLWIPVRIIRIPIVFTRIKSRRAKVQLCKLHKITRTKRHKKSIEIATRRGWCHALNSKKETFTTKKRNGKTIGEKRERGREKDHGPQFTLFCVLDINTGAPMVCKNGSVKIFYNEAYCYSIVIRYETSCAEILSKQIWIIQ